MDGVQQRRHCPGDDLAEGESAAPGVCADCAYGADRQLEGDRDGRLDRRYRVAQAGRFLEIAVGLSARQRELAARCRAASARSIRCPSRRYAALSNRAFSALVALSTVTEIRGV